MPKEIYLKLTLKAPSPLSKFQKIIRIFGFILVLLALMLLIPKETSLSFDKAENIDRQAQTYNPIKIDIEKIGISLSVAETQIVNGTWSINPIGASHLNISADPGVEGNIIMYDHNLIYRFGKIVELKTGDIITLTAEDSKEYSYKVYETIVVDPKNVAVLNETGSQTLTLYTCVGFMDSKRFVLKAKRV